MVGEMRGRFRRWLRRPPRPHGATIVNRRASFLELFYDLVYVAVIGQTGHQLAEHISVRGVVEFAIIFGLIWIAWVNGSLYVELHGGEDGRTRSIVFVEMGILALLAVFTAGASDRDGTAFSMVYAAFLIFTTWLWYTVHRRDRQDSPSSWRSPGAMWWPWAFPPAVILGSGFLPVEPRLVLWAAFAIAWIAALLVLGRSGSGMSLAATHSLVERFGLFTIIVLGEVVFGVVEGLVSAERDGPTVGVGLLALCIGFGFWWIYFDLVGRRLPRSDGGALTNWIVSHFPIALSIAAAGAAIVSLIGHAHDVSAPASTAWLLAGAVALGLLALIVIEQALADAERLFSVYRPLSLVLAIGAVAALAVGWVRPAPWLLALLLVVVLSVLRVFAVLRFLSADAWGDVPAPVDQGWVLSFAASTAGSRTGEARAEGPHQTQELEMRRTAVVVGALFWISNLATLVGSLISRPIPNAADSLTSMYPRETQVVVGTLVAHINDAAIIGYAVVLFPVLKRFNEALALGYVAFKALEATLLRVGAATLLSLIAWSQQYLAAGAADAPAFRASAEVTLAQQFWAARLGALAYLGATPSSMSCCIGPSWCRRERCRKHRMQPLLLLDQPPSGRAARGPMRAGIHALAPLLAGAAQLGEARVRRQQVGLGRHHVGRGHADGGFRAAFGLRIGRHATGQCQP